MSELNRGAFRVWDKEHYKYMDDFELEIYGLMSNGELGCITTNEKLEPLPNYERDDDTVEQFTGFYDANDKPVFEGDILFSSDHGNQGIIWDDRYGWFLNKQSTTLLYECYSGFSESMLIIGTIHDKEKANV